MGEVKTIMIPNGDILVPYHIYSCECCGKMIGESSPKVFTEDGVYCGECAFINGLIGEEEYKLRFLYFLPVYRAEVHDGDIHITTSKNELFPWEQTNKQQRNTERYRQWRTSVFERDSYTCQICGKVGGELNAHHIKPFAKYEELRYEVDNGITLCAECHRKVHKNGNL